MSTSDVKIVDIVGARWYRRIPGWTRQNQVRLNQFFDLMLEAADATDWTDRTETDLSHDEMLRRSASLTVSIYNKLARARMPEFVSVRHNAARAMVTVRLAETACALERFRLSQGAYPKELSELVPKYVAAVPRDPMGDGPLHYERIDDKENLAFGWFRLWSVGLDGHDDAGVMTQDNLSSGKQSDWIWPLPVKELGPRFF